MHEITTWLAACQLWLWSTIAADCSQKFLTQGMRTMGSDGQATTLLPTLTRVRGAIVLLGNKALLFIKNLGHIR